jgi:hypothetical protein
MYNADIFGFTGSLLSLRNYGNLMENVVSAWNHIDLRSDGFSSRRVLSGILVVAGLQD